MEAAIAKHIDPSNLLIERAVAEWTDGDEKQCFLGDEPDSSFNMTVGLDPSTDKLLLWFQLVVSVKRHRAATHSRQRSLFMLFQPDMFDYDHDSCISLNPIPELPALKETLDAISRASLGGDNTRTFHLHLRLKEHSQVVMPKSDPPLIPATEKSRRLLRSFKSLSEATNLSVYVPLGAGHVQSLQGVCDSLLTRQLVNHAIDFESTYNGGAERDVWANFDIFPNSAPRSDSPKVDALAAKIATASPPEVPVTERKAVEAAATEEEKEEGAPEEPVPPLPLYEEQDASTARQSTRSPSSTAAPPLPAYQPGEIYLDGETTEEDEPACEQHQQQQQQQQQQQEHSSPRSSPTRKKRKANDDDDDDNNNSSSSSSHPVKVEPANPAHPPSAPPPPPPPATAATAAAAAAAAFPRPPLAPPPPSSSRPRKTNNNNKHNRVRFSTAETTTTATNPSQPQPPTSTSTSSSSRQQRQQQRQQRQKPRTISSRLDTAPGTLRAALADFLRWLAAVDVGLERRYEAVLWDLGDLAAAGDGEGFYRVRAACKAEVLVGYRRRTAED